MIQLGAVGRAPQRPNQSLGHSVQVLGEIRIKADLWLDASPGKARESQWPAVARAPRFCKRCGRGRFGEASGPAWTRGTRLRTASSCRGVPVKYGPRGELLFLIKKEQVLASNEVPSNPFVSVETLKVCALIGLHLLAAEGEAGSSGSQSPVLGDMWRHGCPMSLEWISSCSASETSCGGEEYEHNNECRAIEVIGQDRSSEVAALFLQDWELGRVALSCHMAMDLLCREMRDACQESSESLGSPCSLWSQCQYGSLAKPSQQQKPFSYRGPAVTNNVTNKERGVVREMTGKRKEAAF